MLSASCIIQFGLQSSLEFSLSFSFAFKYLNARAHFAFTFISGQLLINDTYTYNLQRHIFCNKHGTLINKTNKNTQLPCYKPNIKLQTCKMFLNVKKKNWQSNRGTKWIRKRTNKSKTNKARRHGIQLDVKFNKLHKNVNKVKKKNTSDCID